AVRRKGTSPGKTERSIVLKREWIRDVPAADVYAPLVGVLSSRIGEVIDPLNRVVQAWLRTVIREAERKQPRHINSRSAVGCRILRNDPREAEACRAHDVTRFHCLEVEPVIPNLEFIQHVLIENVRLAHCVLVDLRLRELSKPRQW